MGIRLLTTESAGYLEIDINSLHISHSLLTPTSRHIHHTAQHLPPNHQPAETMDPYTFIRAKFRSFCPSGERDLASHRPHFQEPDRASSSALRGHDALEQDSSSSGTAVQTPESDDTDEASPTSPRYRPESPSLRYRGGQQELYATITVSSRQRCSPRSRSRQPPRPQHKHPHPTRREFALLATRCSTSNSSKQQASQPSTRLRLPLYTTAQPSCSPARLTRTTYLSLRVRSIFLQTA